MGLNLHLYPSPIEYESRILRQTEALAATGWFDGIEIVGTAAPHLAPDEPLDAERTIRRIPMPDFPGPRAVARGLGLQQWARRVEASYRHRPLACINAHSLTVLPLAVRLKRATGAKLVYDTHELETETASSTRLRQALARPTERRLIREADAVFVVSEGIAEWYRQAYSLKQVTVVLNAPSREDVRPALDPAAPSLLRAALGVDDRAVVFSYQGVLGRGRAIEPMLDAFRSIPEGRYLAVMGYGPLEREVRDVAAEHPAIRCLPPVPPDAIVSWTIGADVGLAIHERASLSYELAMPNKLLRYLACGVPTLASPFPEMQRTVMDAPGGPVGWVCSPEAEPLHALAASLSRSEIEVRKARLATWTHHVSWEREADRMLAVYRACIV